ncbi:MAG: tryptophan--tRNA ligase [Candidatus Aenigmatarchaeota archaeon]
MKTKIDVAEVVGEVPYSAEEYKPLLREFGIDDMSPLLPRIRKPHYLYSRGIVVGQRDFAAIIEAMDKRKPFAVLTGANPSGRLHFGNKLFLDQALWLQQQGGEVFIPISNDESYVFKKAPSIEQATKTAMNVVIPNIIAMGFDPERTHIFISTKIPRVYELAMTLSTKVTISTINAIFGFDNSTPPGQVFYAVTQMAHILLPQLPEFGGPKPTVVPIGIDQDPYMRLSRDVAERAGMMKPSSTYHRFMHGLRGGKMSGSRPETCVYMDDDEEAVREKIGRAKTGGAGTVEEQRKNGGNPDVCNVFEYYNFHVAKDDAHAKRVWQECRSGKRVCGDCKAECARLLSEWLAAHRKRVEKAKDKLDKFLNI